MHRALLIPEIVTHIIDCNTSDPGYLYKCLLINNLFFHCSARILWCKCGIFSSASGHVRPYIRHLAQIAQRDDQRGQLYASLVKVLHFGNQVAPYDEYGRLADNENVDEIRYLEELGSLNLVWTSIEVLEIPELKCSSIECRTALIQYLQPRLRKFALHQCSILDDDFMEMLSERCPDLIWLALKPTITVPNLSKETFLRFLTQLRLEYLDIRTEADVWERGRERWMLEVLSKQSSLKQISVPDIDDLSIKTLVERQSETGGNLFPALRSLHSGLSTSAIHDLHRITPHLSVLSLDLRQKSPSACKSILIYISIFSHISRLNIMYPDNVRIDGNDLIHLAQNCRSLSHLSIARGQPYNKRPWSWNNDITDYHIDIFASNAMNLKELYLLFQVPRNTTEAEIYPTESALESIGRQCTMIERLWLTCDPDWFELLQSSDIILFPNLWDLQIAGSEMRYNLGYESEDSLRDMAKNLIARCPMLSDFGFLEPCIEELFDEKVMELIHER